MLPPIEKTFHNLKLPGKLLVCLFVAVFLQILLVSSVHSQTGIQQIPTYEPQFKTYPTLFVLVTPDLLFSPVRTLSPRTDHDVFDRRTVNSQGITNARIAVSASPSPNSLGLHVNVAGRTVSDAVTQLGQRSVLSKDTTRFTIDQQVLLSLASFETGEPNIFASTERQLLKVNSKRLVGSSFEEMGVAKAFERLQTTVDEKATEIARQKLRRELENQTSNAQHQYHQRLGQMLATTRMPDAGFFPQWQDIQLSSSKRVWRIRSDWQPIATQPPPLHVLPISARVHQAPFNQQLQRQFGGRRIDSFEMNNMISQFSAQLRMPIGQHGPPADYKPWAITLSPASPIHFNFDNNAISISISADEIESGKRTLASTKISVSYFLQFRNNDWYAVRDDRVEVESNGKQKRLGARQQIIRTVTRKRFSKLFPREIRIPNWQFSAGAQENPMNFDMQVKTLVAQTGWLSCSLGHKTPRTEHFISN